MLKTLIAASAVAALLAAPSYLRSAPAASPNEVIVGVRNVAQYCMPADSSEMQRFYCRLSGG